MLVRSLIAGIILAGGMIAEQGRAQVLLCPTPPALAADAAGDTSVTSAEAERLLQRLSVALDLHGHRGVDEAAIMRAHRDTPNALLAKLNDVAERCARAARDGFETFDARRPELRKLFLKTVMTADRPVSENPASDVRSEIKPAVGMPTDAEQVERSIDLSVRELWRKLWFRPASDDISEQNRWAVIVASPADADSGWDALGEHQRRWKDVYFQLHQPYYDDNPHHAIVVGRRLSRDDAESLLNYVKELGMADDSYVWPLPDDTEAAAAEPLPAGGRNGRRELDLSILKK